MNMAYTILPGTPKTEPVPPTKTASNKSKNQQNSSFSDKLNKAVSQSDKVATGESEQTAENKPAKLLIPVTPTNIIKSDESAGNQTLPMYSDIIIDELANPEDNTIVPNDDKLLAMNNPALTAQALVALPNANMPPITTSELTSPEALMVSAAITTNQQMAMLPELPITPEVVQNTTVTKVTPIITKGQINQEQGLITPLKPAQDTAAPSISVPSSVVATTQHAQQDQGKVLPSANSTEIIASIVPQSIVGGQGKTLENNGVSNQDISNSEQENLDSGVIPISIVKEQGRDLGKGFNDRGQGHKDKPSDSRLFSQSNIAEKLIPDTVEVSNPYTFAQGLEGALASTTSTSTVASITEPQQQPAVFTDVHQVADQIVEHTRLITKPQNTEMIIKLKPEHLGELTLKVVVENGVINASFHSNNAEVRNIIENSLPQLKQDLVNNGLKVDNVSVYAGLSQFLPNHDQDRNSRQQQIKFTNRKVSGEFVEAIEGDLTEGKITGITSQSGVDYRV